MDPASARTTERLSSLLTFVHELLFPAAWGTGAAFGTIAVVRAGQPGAAFFVGLLLLSSVLFFWSGLRLKTVFATAHGLRVSKFGREVFVRYGEIADVRENKLVGGRPITVGLRTRNAFGRRFVFLPYTAFVLFADHPAATLLRQRAAAARDERR